MSIWAPSPVFLNQDVYLNHLPPEEAHLYEISRDVTLVVLGIMLWDILVCVEDDIQIIKRNRIRAPVLCFIFARVFAAAYILACSVQLTSSLDNPATLLYCAFALDTLTIGCSTFLFLRRVQAVYVNYKYANWFFFILWVIYFGSTAFTVIEISPSNIPGTHRFLATGAKVTFTICMYAALAFDSCVFLAISWKLGQTYVPVIQGAVMDLKREGDGRSGDTTQTTTISACGAWWSTVISGRALPRLSRTILQAGQQYYIFTVVLEITEVTILTIPSVHPIIKGTALIPFAPLTASMACRIFRNLRQFDYFRENGDVDTNDLFFSL